MLKHIYMILASTFVVGFLTGFYVFFASREPVEEKPQITVSEDGFEIIAQAYGGCGMLHPCPSYRIEENGTYTYITYNVDTEGQRYEDIISTQRLEELYNLLEATDFDVIDDSEFTGTCPIAFDGVAYTYLITLRGENYEVDTCVEDVSREALFNVLQDYFEIFALTHDSE